MKFLTLDWETYYDSEYSLSKMSAPEYILDPRFEAHGCGFKWGNEPSFWVWGWDLPDFLSTIDWDDTFALCHNGLFDFPVLRYRYGYVPKMMGDTMAMARNWWRYLTDRVSLATLARHMGRAPKMSTLTRTLGVSTQQIWEDPRLRDEMQIYGPDDCDICWQAFNEMMAEGFPKDQLPIIDRVTRMGVVPQFTTNIEVLSAYHAKVVAQKEQLMAMIAQQAGVPVEDPNAIKKALMSNDQLALLLLAQGVQPPQKVSPVTGKTSYAFAKTDEEFTDLLDHDDPVVQAIVAARLGVKSTIEETRTKRFIDVGNLDWPADMVQHAHPVGLKYSGAHTHRLSGDWKMNDQNMGRESEIRKAVEAPDGQVVVAGDASQVEARLNAGVARCIAQEQHKEFSTLVQQFARNEDVYSNFAGEIYNRPINKADHPVERFIGKTGVLSLGYGSSWFVFQNMVRVKSRETATPIIMTDMQAVAVVETYRRLYPEIANLWHTAGDWIPYMASAPEGEFQKFGPLMIGREVCILPNGNRLNYRDLHQEFDEEKQKWTWWYYFGQRKKRLYGAKFVENFIQAIAFMLIMEADQRIAAMTNGRVQLALQAHDELVYVVPAGAGPALLKIIKQEISRAPDWAPWMPLSASGGVGKSYADTKG